MTLFPQAPGPIGVFDSGYGGLSVFDKIHQLMPEYDYLYLGDNARTPYGPRSFEVVYQFTRQAVRFLFAQGCHLVNTASAKALRTIQQRDLPEWDASRRVLGVIRPTVELMDSISRTKHVGVLGTAGTIASNSYALEIGKMFPHIQVVGEACPMWVPLVECDESRSPGADYFVKRHLDHILSVDPLIDTLILGCTHYPLLMDKIRRYTPEGITLVPQGEYVAASLKDYLRRHPEMDRCLLSEKFMEAASLFLNGPVKATQVTLD